MIYTLPDDSRLVTIETYTREMTLTDPEEINIYSRVYDSLLTDSVTGDRVRELLGTLRSGAMDPGE